jgi:hypothetical protein
MAGPETASSHHEYRLDEADRIDALMSNYKPEAPFHSLIVGGEGSVRVEPVIPISQALRGVQSGIGWRL